MAENICYLATLTCSWYEDDYEEGQVDGTFGADEIEKKVVKSPEEALELFKKYAYGTSKYDTDCGTLYASWMVDEDSSIPSESKIEAWKAGKCHLYNYEVALHVSKLEDIDMSAYVKQS